MQKGNCSERSGLIVQIPAADLGCPVKSVASIVLLAVLVAGCAMRTAYVEPPVIDMAGVDQNRYNNDLSACQQEKIAATATTVLTGFMVGECMERKGYRVLQHKS